MKANPKSTAAVVEAQRRQKLVDLVGEFDAKQAEFDESAKKAGISAARGEIASWSKDSPPEQSDTYEGVKYYATVGERGNVRTVDKKMAFVLMPRESFVDACNLTIKAVEQHASADAQASIISAPERTGPRKVTTSRRGNIREARKAA